MCTKWSTVGMRPVQYDTDQIEYPRNYVYAVYNSQAECASKCEVGTPHSSLGNRNFPKL